MDERTRNLLLGFGGGIAAAIALPIIAPIVTEVARPVTKALLRAGLLGFDYLQTRAARLSEALEDIVAEVGTEVKAELDRRAKEGGATAGAIVSASARRDHGEASSGSSSVS